MRPCLFFPYLSLLTVPVQRIHQDIRCTGKPYYYSYQEQYGRYPYLKMLPLRNNPSLIELCCKLVLSSIRVVKSVSKAERKQMIKDYIYEFLDASPKEIPFNETAWRVLIERADITRDRQMILQFIDGSEYVYNIPNYSPIHRKHLLK